MDDRYVFIDASVFSGIYSHALSNREEIAGFLIGKKINEKLTNDILITDFSPQEGKGTNVNVTLRPEHAAKVREELDKRKTGEKIVGWYHSHPEIKVFMSSDDENVQKTYQDKNKEFVGLVASYISDTQGSVDGIKFRFGVYCLVDNKPEREKMTELRCRVIPREYAFDLPSEASKKLNLLLDELKYIEETNERLKKLPHNLFIEYVISLSRYFSNIGDKYNSIVMDRSNIDKYIEIQTELAKSMVDSEKKYGEIKAAYEKKLVDLKNELKDKSSEAANIKGLYEKVTEENRKVTEENRKLYGTKGKLEASVKEAENKIKKMEDEKRILMNEKESEKVRREEYQKETKNKEQTIKVLRDDISKLKNENENLRNRPEKTKNEKTSLESAGAK